MESCPLDYIFRNGGECVQRCTFSDDNHNCVMCDVTYQFYFTNKDKIIGDEVFSYNICFNKCPYYAPFIENPNKCVAKCERDIYDGHTLLCLDSTDTCDLINTTNIGINCTKRCDYYNQTSR